MKLEQKGIANISFLLVGVAQILIGFAFFRVENQSREVFDNSVQLERKNPDINDEQIVAQKNVTAQQLDNDFDAITRISGFETYGKTVSNYCGATPSPSKWDVSDGWECVYEKSRLIGFSGNFRDQVLKIEKELLSAGWVGNNTEKIDISKPLSYTMINYYDKYYGLDKPKPKNFPDSYLVSDLPPSIFYRNNITKTIKINFFEKSTPESEINNSLYFEMNLDKQSVEKDFENTNDLIDKIQNKNDYAVVITARDVYWDSR